MLKKSIENLGASWYVWIFPAIAIGICIWLFYSYESSQGPRIQIEFDDASGIEPDKTTIRFHGVVVGSVKEVKLNGDKDVFIEVLLTKEGTRFATEGSRFALIKPKASFEGITGLDTIFEGLYIVATPGPEGAAKMTSFKAQKGSIEPEDEASNYVVEADDCESIGNGDAITYRGIKIGWVAGRALTKSAEKVSLKIKIENQYVGLIRTNTHFWRKVGVQAHLGLLGAQIKMNSMESILKGGVEVATSDPPGPKAKALQHFPLDKAPPKNYESWAPALE